MKFIIKLLSVGLKTLPLFCQLGRTRSIVHLPIFGSPARSLENSVLFCWQARSKNPLSYFGPSRPVGKISPHSRPGPARWKNHLRFAGQARARARTDI